MVRGLGTLLGPEETPLAGVLFSVTIPGLCGLTRARRACAWHVCGVFVVAAVVVWGVVVC